MPRTKLDADHWQTVTRDRIKNAIRHAGKYEKDVAEDLRVSPQGFFYKLQRMSLTLEDFTVLVEATGMTDKEILRIVRRK